MKKIKLAFISLLFLGARCAPAHTVEIYNSTSVFFNPANFAFSGRRLVFNVPANTNVIKPYSGTLSAVSASFTDVSCTPPLPVTINFPASPMPVIQQYTLCNGTTISFVIYFTGTNYIMTMAQP